MTSLEPKLETPDVAQIERFVQNYREYIASTGHHVSMAHYAVLVQCKECRKRYESDGELHQPQRKPYLRQHLNHTQTTDGIVGLMIYGKGGRK